VTDVPQYVPEEWQAVIDVHLNGHFNINRAAVNLFREQNYGRMIMVSSTSGLLGNVGQCNYGAAKFGIVALARIVAMETPRRDHRQRDLPLGGYADDPLGPDAKGPAGRGTA